MTSREIVPLDDAPDAIVEVPGSKSLTNRAILAAALAEGSSTLTRTLVADDVEAMVDCVRALGATVSVEGATTRVVGVGAGLARSGRAFARQSGTTARFIAPVLALTEGPWRLDGDPQLRGRPMDDLFVALRGLGATVESDESGQSLPVPIRGPVRAGEVTVSGSTSSQFLSGLLLAAPLRSEPSVIRLAGALVSRPFVEMTVAVMEHFGAKVELSGPEYRVEPGGYRAADLDIEPDASAASYFFAAAAISAGRVLVRGLGSGSLQGDLGFVEILSSMGAQVAVGPTETTVSGSGGLRGVDVDCSELPDIVPTLAVVAAFAEGPTRITGVGFIRSHESDRIAAVVDALGRCGVGADETDDGLVIHPSSPHGGSIATFGDHRMAMAFSVMGLVVPGIEIDDDECVAKTFPGFFSVLDALRHSTPLARSR